MSNIKYKYLGYGITDDKGIAKLDHDAEGNPINHSYTGVGAGKVDIVASLDDEITGGSFVSEIYALYDCGFSDKATDNTKASSYYNYNRLIDVSYSDNGTKLIHSENSTTNRHFYYNSNAISSVQISGMYTILNNMAIEFDLTEINGTIDVYLTDGSNSRGIGLTSTGHYKITIDGERLHLFKDGVEQSLSGTVTMTGDNIRWSFLLNSYNESLTFKDLMIYPI